jgi:hypothetical protein
MKYIANIAIKSCEIFLILDVVLKLSGCPSTPYEPNNIECEITEKNMLCKKLINCFYNAYLYIITKV